MKERCGAELVDKL